MFALAPMQCDGYQRIIIGGPSGPPAEVAVVLRMECILHPEDKLSTSVMIQVQGNWTGRVDLRRILQDPLYKGMWYTAAKAYLYDISQYHALVAQLKAARLPNVLLEEVPAFFFRCLESASRLPKLHAEAVMAGKEQDVDHEDLVYRQLKSFQKTGVEYVIQHGGRAIIADDMGLGKTIEAIAVAHHYRTAWPVLVICPMSLLENWAKEFNKFCGIPFSRIAILQGAKAQASSLHDVVIVSYSSLKLVEQTAFQVAILDESHYIKAPDTKRTQLALKICRESRRVVLLSGTPAMSRPMELYTQLQAIQPGAVPTKTQFGARYCNAFVSRFGIDSTGHSHTEELRCLLRHYIIRRTKKELGDVLPSKTRQLLYVYITEKERKSLERQVVALRRSVASTASTSSGGSERLDTSYGSDSRSSDMLARAPNAFELKIATARAKIPAVQDYVSSIVEQHLESGDKVIFFAHHQCMMEALKAAVEAVRPRQPIDYIYIAGDTPLAQREPAADHFRNEATCAVAILSMQSSGTGHNFTCASTVVFTELDWNPSTHLQCEDRVHRIGQSQACSIKYLLAEGTSDSVIWPLLQSKLSVTTAMLESTTDAAAAVHQLSTGADTRSIARRDLPSSEAAATASSQQSTLDKYLRPSQSSAPSSSRSTAELPQSPVQTTKSTAANGDPDDEAETVLRLSPLLASCNGSQAVSTPIEKLTRLVVSWEEIEQLEPGWCSGGWSNAVARPQHPMGSKGNGLVGSSHQPPRLANCGSSSSSTSVLAMLQHKHGNSGSGTLPEQVSAGPETRCNGAVESSSSSSNNESPFAPALAAVALRGSPSTSSLSAPPRRTVFTFSSAAACPTNEATVPPPTPSTPLQQQPSSSTPLSLSTEAIRVPLKLKLQLKRPRRQSRSPALDARASVDTRWPPSDKRSCEQPEQQQAFSPNTNQRSRTPNPAPSVAGDSPFDRGDVVLNPIMLAAASSSASGPNSAAAKRRTLFRYSSSETP